MLLCAPRSAGYMDRTIGLYSLKKGVKILETEMSQNSKSQKHVDTTLE